MQKTLKKAVIWLLVLIMLAGLLPASLAAEVRDTDFFTPEEHGEMNFDEIEYEYIDPAPLIAEAEALRILCADAENASEFESRYLALAEEYDRLYAMEILLELKSCQDSKDEWVSSELQKVAVDYNAVKDAFFSLTRDALGSPCGDIIASHLSDTAQRKFLLYRDLPEEELELIRRDQELQNEYLSEIVEPVSVTVDGVSYTRNSALAGYYDGTLTYDEWSVIYTELTKAVNGSVGPIFIEMTEVRNKIAELEGYDTYADYAYAVT